MRSRPLLILAVALAACGGPERVTAVQPVLDDGRAYWPAASWRTARPAAVGMDERAVADLVARLRANRIAGFHALVVARFGYLAVEEYFNGASAEELHTLQSVTKSVTSLLVGIAIDRGRIPGVDARLDAFLPAYDPLFAADPRKRAITLASLLTMTSGLDFYEQPYAGSPLERLNASRDDWLRLILEQPMNDAPGGHWQYNSGGVIALGGVLRAATGVSADRFAEEALFAPIGIARSSWFTGQPDGLPHMGGGLALRARDMARLGYLVLRGGRWGDRQVVSERWIRESTRRRASPGWSWSGRATAYGYLWWGLPLAASGFAGDEPEVITASGAQGQWIFVVPSRDLVVAITASTNESSAVDVLFRDLLPTMR